jgi:hypothetical protein
MPHLAPKGINVATDAFTPNLILLSNGVIIEDTFEKWDAALTFTFIGCHRFCSLRANFGNSRGGG